MGHVDWQQLAVYLIGAGAVLYLCRVYLGKGRGGGCESGCGKCGSSQPEAPVKSGLVQIEMAPPCRGEAGR